MPAEVTWVKKKGLGFRFGQARMQPVWAELCKTWHDWLSQLLLVLHSAQAAARMALSLTQLYFMPDPAKRKIMSAVAHLCLMFSAYAGSPSAEGAAVKSI